MRRLVLHASTALLLGAAAACGGPSSPQADAVDDAGDAGSDAVSGDAEPQDAAADGSTADAEADPAADAAEAGPDADAAEAADGDAVADAPADDGGPDGDTLPADAEDASADAAELDAGDPGDAEDGDACPDGGCVDAGPFDDLLALEGVVLLEALASRIDDHVSLGYTAARDAMYGGLDVYDGLVQCIYTGTEVAADGTRTPGGIINTEHAWPRSQGADREPALSDLHHLFPVTAASNNARSDLYYGETACDQTAACSWYAGGSERGASVIDATTIFEVRPVSRGDVARAQFYFAVRYGYTIPSATELALRSWHDEDPPDERERARHEGIAALQGNRNPFVDHPAFVGRVDDF